MVKNYKYFQNVMWCDSWKSDFRAQKNEFTLITNINKTIKMCTLDVYLTCKDIIDGYTTWHFIAIFLMV